MQNKVKIAVMALCYTPIALAQNTNNTEQKQAQGLDEQAFTFTEAQLGEDENMSQNVTILNSSTNLFASQAGYLFSPMRYRYRYRTYPNQAVQKKETLPSCKRMILIRPQAGRTHHLEERG